MITFLVHHGRSGPFLGLHLKQTYCSQVFPSASAFLSLQWQEMVFPSASLYTYGAQPETFLCLHFPLVSWKVPTSSPMQTPQIVFLLLCFLLCVFFSCKQQLCIKHPLDLHGAENFSFPSVCPVFPSPTEMQWEAARKCLVQLCVRPWGCKQNHFKILETFSLWIDFLPKKFKMEEFEDMEFPPPCVNI